MSWIQTYTNLEFRYDDINPDRICLEDIARALSRQARFLGHTNRVYSGGEHSWHVSKRVEVLAREHGMSDKAVVMCAKWGHLHDASEAYVGNLPAPLKQLPFMEGYVALEKDLQSAIKKKFCIVVTPEMEAFVKHADLELLNTERRHLLGPSPAGWIPLPPPIDIRLYHWNPVQAEQAFLARWKGLM